MAGWLTNGVATTDTPPWLSRFSIDTELAQGVQPQTEAVALLSLALQFTTVTNNTATSTVHAATLNTSGGNIITEALTTAVGATYTFTLTNSLVTAASVVNVVMVGGTNTGGTITLTSVTPASGSVVFVWTNTGTTAFNGTMLIAFHL